jgi:hypothetical protein
MTSLHVLAGIAWDPNIRAFLTLAVGVVVLLGSIYLLLATNVGVRLGFLIAATAFWGWLFIMGCVWWMYGTVGMLGTLNHWEVKEIDYPTLESSGLAEARGIETGHLPPVDQLNKLDEDGVRKLQASLASDLDGWKILPEAHPAFGDAKATVDEYFTANPIPDLNIKGAEDYVVDYSFERGGKNSLPANPSRLDRIGLKLEKTLWQVKNPPHYAIVQVQPVLAQVAQPGQAPPLPKADPSAPVVNVVMERNLGQRRGPGALLAISSGIMFGLLVNALHRRDKRALQAQGLLPATTEA